MHKSSKVAKNRVSTAVPAERSHAAPFVPAAIPGSDLHWRKAATRKAKSAKSLKAATGDVPLPRNKTKNRTSEYDEKFVEWELPEHALVQHEKQYAPTGFYETDMNAFDWKSEQKRNYVRKDGSHLASERTAGVARPGRTEAPASFAWELDNQHAEGDHEGARRTTSQSPNRRNVSSENHSKYNWPAHSERAKSAKPAAVPHGSPIALDSSALVNNGQQWLSEYDAQTAELRRKQQELLHTAQTTAGIASQRHGIIPSFYAWEQGDDEPQPRDLHIHPVSRGGAHGSTSEYKMKFVEWGPQERQRPIMPVVGAQLDLFHEDHPAEAARSPERTSSVLHQDYPGHDVAALGYNKGHHTIGTRSKDVNPKSFAWPLVDGGGLAQESEDEEFLQQSMPRKHKVKNLIMPNSNCSEYTRTYGCPPHEAYTHVVKAQKPAPGKALDLFAAGEGEAETKRVASEYNAQYKVPVGAQSPKHVTAASSASAHQSYPTQFAWALVNGGEKACLESPARTKRAPLPNQDVSEYQRKFHWPAPGDRAVPHRGVGEERGEVSHHRANVDSIMGLDAEDLNSSKWQSEYDMQTSQLRQKQLALQDGHIAGVPTKQRDVIPTNYAWEMPAPVVPDLSGLPPAHKMEQSHSEYGDSFVQWPTAKREMIRPKPLSESLNLFAVSEESKGEVHPYGDASTAGDKASRSKQQSEYAEQFHAYDAAASVRTKSANGQRGVPLPAQFAWPRVDPPSPPSVAPKHDGLHPVFSEVSEYDSKFAWPPASVPAKIVRPQSGGTTVSTASVIVSIPEKTSSEEAPNWVSEYGAHAADAVHGDSHVAAPAAGVVTTVQNNIPHFYAWMEEEANKVPKVELPRYTGEQVRSEYDENFKVWPVSKVDAFVPKPPTEILNVFASAGRSGGAAAPEPIRSEYESSFHVHTAEAIKQEKNPFPNSKSSAIEVPKPPQFAWPLIDGDAKHVAHKTMEGPNTPHSEYATQFTWHGLAETAHGRRGARTSTGASTGASSEAEIAAAVAEASRSVMANAPIAFDEQAMKTSDWSSEYDAQSANLRQKQLEPAAHRAGPIAGVQTRHQDDAPSFYAWEPAAEKKPIIPIVGKSTETGLTEYTASFTAKPIKSEAAGSSNRRGGESRFSSETFKTFQFGKDRSFQGITEYDDQYVPKMPLPTPPTASHQLTAAMEARYTATNLLNPPPPPVPAASTGPTRTNGKIATTTESNAHYQWPDKSKLSAKTAPLLNSQKSQMIIGVNHPAAMALKKGAPKVPFRSAHVPRSVRSSDDDSFPESEFQSSFAAVHPEVPHTALQENVPSTANVSVSRKYQLMSQELKARRAVGGTRSDYTTGVHSASSATPSGASTSRAATADSNSEAFAATARTTMSADSLARTTERVSSGTYNGIPGLRQSENLQLYRAQSAPHRQRLAVSYDIDPSKQPAKVRTTLDDTANNPVLMHKRYPYISKKQLGRWSTETGDQFRWRKKAHNPTSAVSMLNSP